MKSIPSLLLFATPLLLGSCGNKQAANTASEATNADQLTMLVGTYTNPDDTAGIYTFRFDQATGQAVPLSSVAASNPSFLTPNADATRVYAVAEMEEGHGGAAAFDFDRSTGRLTPLNVQPTGGDAPCYIIADSTFVVTANYGGGSISVFPLAEDGSLEPSAQMVYFTGTGADAERQTQPHLHCVRLSPDGRYLFADDLGTDRVYKYSVNPTPGEDAEGEDNDASTRTKVESPAYLTAGTPAYFTVAPASGPRHLEFAPDADRAYLINEISGTVTAFDYDPSQGNLKEFQTARADTLGARGSGDIHLSPDGRFLYASNRLRGDGIAIFSVNPEDGTLTRIAYQPTGPHPRNFAITHNGLYLLVACRDSNAIEVYRRDPSTGLLTPAGASISLPRPVCIRFVEA